MCMGRAKRQKLHHEFRLEKRPSAKEEGRSEILRTNDMILIGTSVLSATREWYYL